MNFPEGVVIIKIYRSRRRVRVLYIQWPLIIWKLLGSERRFDRSYVCSAYFGSSRPYVRVKCEVVKELNPDPCGSQVSALASYPTRFCPVLRRKKHFWRQCGFSFLFAYCVQNNRTITVNTRKQKQIIFTKSTQNKNYYSYKCIILAKITTKRRVTHSIKINDRIEIYPVQIFFSKMTKRTCR